MDWILGLVAAMGVLGAVLAVRDRIKGRKIIDERDPDTPQSETDRIAMRTDEAQNHHSRGDPH